MESTQSKLTSIFNKITIYDILYHTPKKKLGGDFILPRQQLTKREDTIHNKANRDEWDDTRGCASLLDSSIKVTHEEI